MELRRDPITHSWVIVDEGDIFHASTEVCPLCPGKENLTAPTIFALPYEGSDWQVRVVPHLRPLYRIEVDPQRRPEGIYDRMRNLGAHEIVVENREHNRNLTQADAQTVALVVRAYASRVSDLKKDRRFRYITVFRNQGALAGQDFEHPHSEITATPFIPRRLLYELRAAKEYYQMKERCVFCDILQQELRHKVRAVDWTDEFVALCPFASRVPYETWILPIYHHCAFEQDMATPNRAESLAGFLKATLRRLEAVAGAYHLVLHTAPATETSVERANYWKTLADDYHWHMEILPIAEKKSKSYSIKEVYYNSVSPEGAASGLRDLGARADTG